MDDGTQSKFIAGLRAFAEREAAKNPTFAKLRSLSKSLVDETRRRFKAGDSSPTIGACLLNNHEVQIVVPQSHGDSALAEIVATLKRLAAAGQISGGAWGTILERPLVPNGPTVAFIDVHAELLEGLALRSAVPADLSILEKGLPGMNGPALPGYGKKVEPKIFNPTSKI